MSAESAEGRIDPRIFIKQLAPDQLGVFEPLSGLMLLNITAAGLVELGQRWAAQQSTDADVAILRTINHETYHFAQVAASGYMFHREARLLTVLNTSAPLPEPPLDPDMQALLEAARAEAGDDPELKRRYEQVVAMLQGHERIAQLNASATTGDNSLMGALLPGFFAEISTVMERETVTNAEGLSILGVLEGSAVVHTHLLMHPNGDAAPYLEAELASLPPVYRELHDITTARVGSRALELLLPAVALALRYAHPHNAYVPLLALLAESAPDEALARGRTLAAQLPDLHDAGPRLGTALELRLQDDSYRVYDPVLEKLAADAWGIDSYDFLARPSAMEAVGSFPMGIVTNDNYLGSLPKEDIAARMVLMGAALRSQSRRRAERSFRGAQEAWAHNVIVRLVDRAGPS